MHSGNQNQISKDSNAQMRVRMTALTKAYYLGQMMEVQMVPYLVALKACCLAPMMAKQMARHLVVLKAYCLASTMARMMVQCLELHLDQTKAMMTDCLMGKGTE